MGGGGGTGVNNVRHKLLADDPKQRKVDRWSRVVACYIPSVYLSDGSAQTIVRVAVLSQKMQVKFVSPSHSILIQYTV